MIEDFRDETGISSHGPLAVDYLVLAYLAATGLVALTSLSGMGLGIDRLGKYLDDMVVFQAGHRTGFAAPVRRDLQRHLASQ